MSRLVLPACAAREDPFALSPEDRRELVRRIAEHGPDAIDAFIREREAQDSSIARKVQRLRDELMRRAEELRRRLADEFSSKREQADAEFKLRLAQLRDEEAALRGEMDRLQGDELRLVEAEMRADPVLGIALSHDVAARAPWWRRALAALGRILRWLLFPLLWLLRKVTPPARRQDRAVLAVPGILDKAGGLYLGDATFRKAVKGRLRAAPTSERVRRAWERLLGREDYESLARKAMAEMMAEDAERAKGKAQQRQRALEESLAGVAERERETEQDRERRQRQLEAERDRDAKALEDALRNAPEREVKEAIVDELKAAGLLREATTGLAPTLQFMDRFAALLYEDESRAMGGRGSTQAGDYAEGEGHYLRGPMRMAIEASRMDILASRLRARSRHPHVKHMVDDDVVVHREERASTLHVVLVVDRSGSMEENGRMEAAKRAALALNHAVRQANPRNRVDVLLMDTSVRSVTLREVWDAEPRGFTNHGAALRLARELARRRKSQRLLVYMVTDGLPEAYTKEGEDVAGHPDKAMAYAKEQARLLRRERALSGFVMLLLEPKDERYVKAAKELARECGGRVQDVDPQELARTLLKQFEQPLPA